MSSTNDQWPIFSDALDENSRTAFVLGMTLEELLARISMPKSEPKSLGGEEIELSINNLPQDDILSEETLQWLDSLRPKPKSRSLIETRPTWDQYGMQIATAASLRGDCVRRQVGAALMAADHSIISLGYNGGPSKGASCMAGECPRGRLSKEELPGDSAYDTGGGTCVALHAEWNVLIRTAWHQFAGSTLYVTHPPCHICKVMIAGTDIARVVAPSYEWKRPGL